MGYGKPKDERVSRAAKRPAKGRSLTSP